jgi:hypothetical protein
VAEIRYVRGPEMIRSENTFPVAYVTFGARPGLAEVEVVEQAQAFLDDQVRQGNLAIPAGVSYTFAGSYENQLPRGEDAARGAARGAPAHLPHPVLPVPERAPDAHRLQRHRRGVGRRVRHDLAVRPGLVR